MAVKNSAGANIFTIFSELKGRNFGRLGVEECTKRRQTETRFSEKALVSTQIYMKENNFGTQLYNKSKCKISSLL